MLLDLTEDRWRRLESLFHSARELPLQAREAFLDREAAGDPALRQELNAMLARAGDAPGLIANLVKRVAGKAAHDGDLDGSLTGRRMGPYRLVREVGRGGMGVVFEARRDDDEYSKTVAVKVAPEWRRRGGVDARFRGERQILAGLEHPNIARFLDGGSEDGVPYFAMEYVEGSPITEYCREQALSLRARIALFRQVCAAVHHAHENLVVHRDLKPENILVGRDGVPKLLDFGIAKLLGPLPDAEGATVGLRMTPDYTSPEQVRGGAVTTRTDVYSLGLILYEMLCGERAQTADASSPLALDRSICETEPPPASQAVAARGDRILSRQLRGDLDTILATAMRKEPERRYGSAAAFSQDLGRYLEGKPVEARPGTLIYRSWKAVRRHRAVVAAVVLLVASVTVGVLATLAQARRAERRFQQVRGLANSVLFGVHDRIQNLAGATEAREWAVRTALEYLDNLAKDAGRDKPLLLELASAYIKVGDVQGYPVAANLGHPQAAMESYRKALSIAERLGANDANPQVRRLLAQSHQRVGALLRVFQQADAGIAEFRRALAVEEPLYRAHPGDPDDSRLMIVSLVALGQAEVGVGGVREANLAWSQALEIAQRWDAENPSDESRARLGGAQCGVSRGLQYEGELDRAAQHARECVAIREALAQRQPANAAFRRELMNAYLQMAYVYWHPAFLSFEDREAAAPLEEKALDIARELATADASNATAQFDLAIAEADLCSTVNRDRPQLAIAHCRKALAIADRYSPRVHPGSMWAGLASALQASGRRRDALEAIRSALNASEAVLRPDPARVSVRQSLVRARLQMSALLLETGDRESAMEHSRRALTMAEELAAAHPTDLMSRRDLADTYQTLGRISEGIDWRQARAWHQKSLDIWSAWSGAAPSTRMDQARRERAAKAVARCARRIV